VIMVSLTRYADNINNEQAGSCVVNIGGVAYTNFVSMTLRCSTQDGTCQGTIVLSWPGSEQFDRAQIGNTPLGPASFYAGAFIDGAQGTIELDGQLAATIIFDKRVSKGSPTHYELSLQFRGKASCAIDSSPQQPETGQMSNMSPANMIQQLVSDKGIGVIDMSGQAASQIKRFIVAEGETAERAARRISRDQMGVQMFENPQGNWVLLGVNQVLGAGAGSLIVGRNITNWSVTRNLTPRFGKAFAALKSIPTDQKYGGGQQGAEAVHSIMEMMSSMPGMGCRTIDYAGDGDHTDSSGQQNVSNEQESRSQQGLSATVRLPTWTDAGGQLYQHGKMYHTVIDVDGVNDNLKCQEVVFELTPESRSTTLTLVDDSSGSGGGGFNAPAAAAAAIKARQLNNNQAQPAQAAPTPGTLRDQYQKVNPVQQQQNAANQQQQQQNDQKQGNLARGAQPFATPGG